MNTTINAWIIIFILGSWLMFQVARAVITARLRFWQWRLRVHVERLNVATDELTLMFRIGPDETEKE